MGNFFEEFPQMLLSLEDPLANFRKGLYEPSFRNYVEKHQDTLEKIEEAYENSKEPEELVRRLAETLIEQVKKRMEGMKKRQQEDAMMNYNMSIVIYLDPALLDHNIRSGKPLAEELLRQWKQAFPKTDLKLSDFETINGGFKRRFCYITTAVCESLGKPDDCYELAILREYRDGYLQQLPEGERLVKQYYDVAPTIVKHINMRPERQSIYNGIWQEYLRPCIGMIEKGQRENCRKLYQQMVEQMQELYFYCTYRGEKGRLEESYEL